MVIHHMHIFLAYDTAAGAMPAVHGTDMGHQKQDPVGVTMGKTGNRAVAVLVQGIILVTLVKYVSGSLGTAWSRTEQPGLVWSIRDA
jgi:hypothetical protein